MRTQVLGATAGADPDERLTTGEAARLLDSSRQHVVDLCDRGVLPFTTTGRHRRVRRGDIDELRAGNETLTRDQDRSLWLAFSIAGRIVADPERARSLAHENLDRMTPNVRGSTRRLLDEWRRLIDGPIDQLLAAYTSRSVHGRELRQVAPFAGLLADEERILVLDAWRQDWRSRNGAEVS